MEKDKKRTVLLVIPALLAMIWLAFRIIAPYDNERVYYEALEKSYPNIAKIVEIKARPYTYTAHGRIYFELEAKDGHFVRPFYSYTFMLDSSLAETLPAEVTQALERGEEVFLVVETGNNCLIQTVQLAESPHVLHYIRVVIDGILFLLLVAFLTDTVSVWHFETPAPQSSAGSCDDSCDESAALIQAVYTKSMFSAPKRHNGKCDGDCKHCPPHYGYRYGRWYYGHDHAWGCEFGGNKCSGSMD